MSQTNRKQGNIVKRNIDCSCVTLIKCDKWYIIQIFNLALRNFEEKKSFPAIKAWPYWNGSPMLLEKNIETKWPQMTVHFPMVKFIGNFQFERSAKGIWHQHCVFQRIYQVQTISICQKTVGNWISTNSARLNHNCRFALAFIKSLMSAVAVTFHTVCVLY